jgi:tyrosinase
MTGAHHEPAGASTASGLRALHYRKNIAALSTAQLQTFRRVFTAVEAIADDRGYDHWAGIHGLPLPSYCQHGTRLFLPWHRAYLYFFELALRDQVSDASLCWWDWTSAQTHATGIPAAYAEQNVGGQPNPLYRTTVPPVARRNNQPQRTSRSPGPPGQLPAAAQIQWMLRLPDFLDFQMQLENIHNSVHVWVGGTMGDIRWAAYDPIFFAHHTMIDRLWRLWQLRHPNPQMPSDLLQQALPPFAMTVQQTLSIERLGYGYASSTAWQPATAQSAN